jgi:foldase protein PrsA
MKKTSNMALEGLGAAPTSLAALRGCSRHLGARSPRDAVLTPVRGIPKLLRRPGRAGICALLAVVVAVLSGCGSSTLHGNVVAVGTTPISTATFDHWMRAAVTANPATKGVAVTPPSYSACIAHFAAAQAKSRAADVTTAIKTTGELKSECETQYNKMKQTVLKLLIPATWTIDEAKRLGVGVTASQVQKRFEVLKRHNFPGAAFQEFLKKSGQSLSDILWQVKLELLKEEIEARITGRVHITEAQVRKYYEENRSYYEQPERRSVEMVRVRTRGLAQAAKLELASGESFASVAKKRSIEPTSQLHEDESRGLTREDDSEPLSAAIFNAKPGALTGPVGPIPEFGYYVFRVKRIINPTLGFAQVKTSVRERLVGEEGQAAMTMFSKEYRKRWKARTDCADGYVVEQCKQYRGH